MGIIWEAMNSKRKKKEEKEKRKQKQKPWYDSNQASIEDIQLYIPWY